MLPPFSLLRPTTLREALAEISEDVVPYCGGTELLLAMRAGLFRPTTLVDLKRVPELRGVEVRGGVLRIGGAVTHIEVSEHPEVRRLLPLMSDVERKVGNARVRAQGTIAGNLCFGEPKSDITTTLIALGATVTLTSLSAARVVPVADFLDGAYATVRAENELLTMIDVPLDPQRRGVYLKYQIMERPTVGIALVAGGAAGGCRVVVGAVGEVPAAFQFEAVAAVEPGEIAAALDPVPDLTGSARYKRHVTEVFVRRAVSALEGGGDARG